MGELAVFEPILEQAAVLTVATGVSGDAVSIADAVTMSGPEGSLVNSRGECEEGSIRLPRGLTLLGELVDPKCVTVDVRQQDRAITMWPCECRDVPAGVVRHTAIRHSFSRRVTYMVMFRAVVPGDRAQGLFVG